MKKAKLLSLLLVVAMLFTMSVPVFAEGESVADRIAAEAVYEVRSYMETKTVTIDVSVENNPELMSIGTVYDVTMILVEKQAELDDGSFVLMSEKHIAGELLLHVLMYNFANTFGGSAEDSQFHSYYMDGKDARLNIDEDRIETSTINILGTLVIVFGQFL